MSDINEEWYSAKDIEPAMEEEYNILKDLKEYLDKRGIETDIHFDTIDEKFYIGDFYLIVDGNIVSSGETKPIVSIADPKYKEKFAKYIGADE